MQRGKKKKEIHQVDRSGKLFVYSAFRCPDPSPFSLLPMKSKSVCEKKRERERLAVVNNRMTQISVVYRSEIQLLLEANHSPDLLLLLLLFFIQFIMCVEAPM